MAVHIELAELDEMCEEPAADCEQRFTATRISDGLGRRRLPATVALRLVMRFHTQPGEDVSIATDLLSHTGETVFSREDLTNVPSNGRAHLAIDIPVMLTEPGPYTVHLHNRRDALVTEHRV